jgi:ribosome-binding protein aMBF1 (putative translation factor)
MNCKICGEAIKTKEDIHWLEDVIVCSDCYKHETGEEND